jgi:signal recognition particle receptor subunit beta
VPTFDPLLRRLIARVVYDGPALCGKTTNVKRICELFPVQKRTELYTPGSLKGRTMFFDWLEVQIGKVGQLALTCQVLSVPGQRARSYRRKPLIQSADAVVFVADSGANQLDETRRCYALMRRYLRSREDNADVPHIVQANKQDGPLALAPEELATALRLASHVLVVPGIANEGEGVRETFAAAVQAAVRFTQQYVRVVGLDAIAGTPENPDSLLDALLLLEDKVDDMAAEEEPSEAELTN